MESVRLSYTSIPIPTPIPVPKGRLSTPLFRFGFGFGFGFGLVGYSNGLCSQPQPRPVWMVRSSKPELSEWQQQQQQSLGLISACFVGLLTGLSVVLFNNLVHEIRDICWDGIPLPSQSESESGDKRIIFIPACGGLLVSLLTVFENAFFLKVQSDSDDSDDDRLKGVLKPILKALGAAVTLGTGNSLGPEGPSVDIGASVAKGIASFSHSHSDHETHQLSLKAAGSAAGISSGFNAAVAGCFFAVESVLWPSPSPAHSLTNTTSTVILSAVIASVVSQIGLGSQPAFTVPDYDFRSASELPLYLLLGVFCGLVSLSLSWCTSWMMMATDKIHKTFAMPKAVFPVLGGFTVGLIALIYPQVLYWGFENVDILLESRPFGKGLPVELLLQLVAIKIVATSLCRACGLVGGYYAPSLFIGAATGMAYGKAFASIISQLDPLFHLSGMEVASPQAYGLKLKTQDKLKNWEISPTIHVRCSLCELQPDSHNHLFFECNYSAQVWAKIKVFANMQNVSSCWEDIVAWLQPMSHRKMVKSVIARLVLAAATYYVWQERNNRLFKKGSRMVHEQWLN